MNPYYEPEKMALQMVAFDEQDMCYAFNTLCFWATDDGKVYTAKDSGCSCPTPFEDHDHSTRDEVLQSLERVGSVDQALATYDAWAREIEASARPDHATRRELAEFVTKHLMP